MKKYYRIAELNVEMDTFGRAEIQAKKYLISEKPDHIDIVIKPDRRKTHTNFPELSETDVEYMATGSSFHTQVLNFRGMMLHSSAVVMDGKAYLFSAPCGTGKSTHTELWKRVFGAERARILNDDKPVLRFKDDEWYAYGTPWSGKTAKNVNMKAPIAGICFISRSSENSIARCEKVESVQMLLMQTPKPKNMESRCAILDNVDSIVQSVPIWKLQCNMDEEAAIVSYEAMSGKKWRLI